MPWKVSDVDTHKKGLTPKQKRQWVAVANSVMAACLKDGGTDATCAPQAIQQASGVVNKMLDVPTVALSLTAKITKADDSQQRLFGWASIAVRKDGTQIEDLQGDILDIGDLEEAWYDYVVESGELNFEHQGPVRGHLIEALVVTPEKLDALGLPADSLPLGAWVGYEIPDAGDYAAVKKHGFFMFSIEGSALREPA